MTNWNTTTAFETAASVAKGEISAREVAEAALRRIEALEPRISALLTVTADRALETADAIDARRSAGEALPPLAGVPVAVKANMAVRGVETNCASKILKGWKPPYTATVPGLLEDAGAVFVGTANMDEFAMGSSTENSAYQVTHNPWDTERVPGGSSGGSAAAVAAGEALMATGSDTGGSIRQPASYCGVVGMKPTYGRISRFGLVAFASSLDQIGPITRDVRDAALMMNVIARHDPRDSTSADIPAPDYLSALTGDVRGLRIGRPAEFFVEGIQPEVRNAIDAAFAKYEELGAQVVDVSLPYVKYAMPAYYIIAPCEASSNLARYDGVRYGHRTGDDLDMIQMFMRTRREGFGPEVKRRIMIGTYALSSGYYDAWYRKAQQVRTLIRRDFDRVFEQCDVLLTPTAPATAFRIGEKVDDQFQMYLEDVCTIPVNLAGLPGLSVPCGSAEGMPVGMQLIGRHFEEDVLLKAGHAFEQATEWGRRLAPIAREVSE